MPGPTLSPIYDLARRYVEEWAPLDPIGASSRGGITTFDHLLTDYSPGGVEQRANLMRRTLRELEGLPVQSDADRIAAGFMRERLTVQLADADLGEHLRPLRIIGSPVGSLRGCFDNMSRDGEDDWERIATRLEQVPVALGKIHQSLVAGLEQGLPSARRQANEVATQVETWAGEREAMPYFATLTSAYSDRAGASPALRSRLERAASAATAAYAGLGRYLRETYAPAAPDKDAVGRERYLVAARNTLGDDIDPEETYAWAWDELFRIEAEMAREADRILPGGTIEEAKALLESDPARAIEGVDNLQRYLQDLMDRTIADLDGVHFDIPEPVRRVEAMIAPPGSAAAMYYTGPSEDFTRPGRTWYPTMGQTRFPLWGEISICYHEGVPGHHLHIATARYLAPTLSRFQGTHGVSGQIEGWALYAERLMDELGYLEVPDYRLGMLRAQAMRAVRVIVDIGMHLELEIPRGQDFHPGEIWNPVLGQQFANERSHFSAAFMASEITRYLGLPSQAICYKVGERAWLETREEVKRRQGDAFDLKEFHKSALDLGMLGLAQMREELVRT